MPKKQKYILNFREISKQDVPLVGGKNASLGEMFSKLTGKGINVPDGFALTSAAYWYFLKENGLDKKLNDLFKKFNRKSLKSLQETGKAARQMILNSEFPSGLEKQILQAYGALSKRYKEKASVVAARSSATAEDLPSASFAGQHETYLNVKGEKALLDAVKKCISSLFTDRAIAYREEKKFNHLKIALSVGVQKMVKSGKASSGIIFTLDTETGFRDVVLINSIWGVGEMIVKGKITPDEFYVFKPTLSLRGKSGKSYRPIIVKNLGRKNKKYIYHIKGGLKEVKVAEKEQLKFSLRDDEILTLANWAVKIEEHYKKPQDIEWAKDSQTGRLFIVQSRPETVHGAEQLPKRKLLGNFQEYQLKTKKEPILKGIAIGGKIGQGKARVIDDIKNISQFQKGEVLVTKMTDPDWLPIMRLASAVVTDEGGRTCHAAIVARELGIPAIVGAKQATQILKTGQEITVDCSQGTNGRIFEGRTLFKIKKYDLKKIAKLKTKIMLNIGAPEAAFRASQLPNDGVGLARLEFIIAEKIKVHPLALYHFDKLNRLTEVRPRQLPRSDLVKLKKKINEITIEHKDKKEFFVKELAEGVGQIAAGFYPKPVIVRLSDFKTNEYRALIGGELFEPEEENPMLGWRGASRYYHPDFQPAFQMELSAIKRARDVFGLKNIKLMVPFCRTVEEGGKVIEIMKKAGLQQGRDGLEIYVMCEIPSNVVLAEKFLEIFDGMSIGSNDLTQLALGIDRDNAGLQKIADERNEAVKEMIAKVIKTCRAKKKYCGICGQAPSDFPDFAKFLIEQGIYSISLNPDTVIKTRLNLA